jgi:hypothetical protein
MKPEPQFLRVQWEENTEQGAITLEAMACLQHRREIALACPSARGAGGGRGDDCELCAGSPPRTVGAISPHCASQSARVP